MDVRIDRLERQGQVLWRVQMGRRSLIFHEELAARTFAAGAPSSARASCIFCRTVPQSSARAASSPSA